MAPASYQGNAVTQPRIVEAPTPTTTSRRRRRWPWYVVAAFGLPLLFLAGGYWYLYWSSGRETETALAETDRLDPGWRLDDLEAAREILKPEENSALHVTKVVGMGGNARTW